MASDNLPDTKNIVDGLLDENKAFEFAHLKFFSDISKDDLNSVIQIWDQVSDQKKNNLLNGLTQLMATDTLISCDDFSKFLLEDSDDTIKAKAIELLKECPDTKLIQIFSKYLQSKDNPILNKAAARGLGKYVLLGELDEISTDDGRFVQDILVQQYQNQTDDAVRMEILKSLGYSSRSAIPPFIKKALNHENKAWSVAALIAISRTADQKWEPVIQEKLSDPDIEIQKEAVKAAGELELSTLSEPLIDLLEEFSIDDDIYYHIIWALSQIGGNNVKELFESLLALSEDDEFSDMIDIALENLELSNGFSSFDLI